MARIIIVYDVGKGSVDIEGVEDVEGLQSWQCSTRPEESRSLRFEEDVV